MKRYEAKYFSYKEFDSPDEPGSGSRIDDELLRILDIIREQYGKPIHINSGVRSVLHNKSVGGKSLSQHLLGRAADLHIPDQETGDLFETIALREGAKGIGRYVTKENGAGFIHLDVRQFPNKRGYSYWTNEKYKEWKKQQHTSTDTDDQTQVR